MFHERFKSEVLFYFEPNGLMLIIPCIAFSPEFNLTTGQHFHSVLTVKSMYSER